MRRARELIARFVPRGAAILSILLFGSYLMGLLRDRIFAGTFGASAELDAYNAAFQLPEILFDVLVEAGLAAAFIPIFVRLRSEADRGEADRFARVVLTIGVTVMGVGSVLLFAFAEPLVGLVAPGFVGAQRALYLDLFRLMLVTQVLFAASLTLGQILLVEQRYVWYGIAPLLYNAGIAAGTLTLAEPLGIYAAAIGAMAGAAVHLGSRFVGLRHSSFRIGFARPRWDAPIRDFVRLTLPKLVSQPLEPITILFFNAVASGLAAGSLSILSYARNFQSVPVSLVGVAFAVAAFPALSRAFAAGDRPRFRRLFGTNLVSIAALTVAAAVVMIVVGELAIGILLGGGAFGPDEVATTAAVLSAFALSVPFESASQLLSRAIFATRHTLFQALASIAGLLISIAATLLLVGELDLLAFPLSFAIGQAAKTTLLAVVLGWRLRTWPATSPLGEWSG